MSNPLLVRALRLFEEERAALRAGRIKEVAGLANQKAEVAEQLAAMRLSKDDIRKLRDKATENARLLQAAIKGVKDAQTRLAALRDAAGGLQVYDAGGEQQYLRPTGASLEQKL